MMHAAPNIRAAMALVCLLALALVTGCAAGPSRSAPDQYVAKGYLAPPKGSIVLLLHLPAVEPSYRSGDGDARTLVQQALVRAGYKVGIVDPDDYLPAFESELGKLGRDISRLEARQVHMADLRALAIVARAGSEASGSHLLVRTRLLTRPAELWQSHAYWDGVVRPIVFSQSKPGVTPREIKGTGTGVSIEVTAVGATGQVLLRTFGGIALPFAVNFLGIPMDTASPFTRPHLEEGVGAALSMLLPQ